MLHLPRRTKNQESGAKPARRCWSQDQIAKY